MESPLLERLEITGASMDLTFDPNVLLYPCKVDNNVTEIIIKAYVANPTYIIKINEEIVENGVAKSIPTNVSDRTIDVEVCSSDGRRRVYIIYLKSDVDIVWIYPKVQIYVRELDTFYDARPSAEHKGSFVVDDIVLPQNPTIQPRAYLFEIYTNEIATGITETVIVYGGGVRFVKAKRIIVNPSVTAGGPVAVKIEFDLPDDSEGLSNIGDDDCNCNMKPIPIEAISTLFDDDPDNDFGKS